MLREETDGPALQRAQGLISSHFAGARAFQPSAVLVATWDQVAGHKLNPQKTEVIIFFIYLFSYSYIII